jgi:hypothetical protein
VLSRAVAERAGWNPKTEALMEVSVRGVNEPIEVIGLARGRDLPSSILVFTDEERIERPMAWTMGRWGG